MCVSSNVVMYEYDDDDDDGWGIFGREVKENGYHQESRAWGLANI